MSVNTAAVERPGLVTEIADEFGSQCVVVAVDARRTASSKWEVCTHGGRRSTGIDALEWVENCSRMGAGEILLTSMDRDGTRSGFDLDLTSAVADAVSVPVIASGGVGKPEDLVDGARSGADAVLAASIFHSGEISIYEAKRHMARAGVSVRPGHPSS